MKAAVFRGVGKPLEIETQADPTPGPDQVVIKVNRCGVCGTDLHLTDGHNAAPVPEGTVLGHEYAGEVVATGPGVRDLAVGDRVTALPLTGCGRCEFCRRGEVIWCRQSRSTFGGYAQYVQADTASCIKLPTGLSFDDGALIEPLSVSLHGVMQAGLTPEKKILVMGAGPIGLGVVFWARRFGVAGVTVVEGSPSRADIAYRLGADIVRPPVMSTEIPTEFAFGADDTDETPEIVFECVGKYGLLAQAIRHVRPRGTVVSLGCCMRPDSFVPAAAAVKELTMRFPIVYSVADFHTSIGAFEAGAIEPRHMITDTVGLDDMPPAFESLRSPSEKCKLMVAPWGA